MNRRTVSLVVLIVAAITVVAVPAAALGPGGIAGGQGLADDVGDESNETNPRVTTNGTDNATPPGSKLTGVVGVQKAKIESEVQSRGFEIAFNRSDDNNSKAAVIADQVTDLESKLDALQERKNEFDQARANGTIGEGEYRAGIAEIGARISMVQRLANQTENASRGVPAKNLERRGVNVTEIRGLSNSARNLSGQEVAAIAREIAGPGAGKGLGRGPPANKTNPGQGHGPNPGQGHGPNPGQGNGANPGQGNGTNPGQGNGANPEQGNGTNPGQGNGANPEQGNGTNPGQGNGPNSGQGNGVNPGQGNGANPGQGNEAPRNGTAPGSDTGPGDDQPGIGEPGPPESNIGNNETDMPDLGAPGNGTDAPEEGDTNGQPTDTETNPDNGTESGVYDGVTPDNGTAPSNGGSDRADDGTSMSVSDTAYAGTLDGIVTD